MYHLAIRLLHTVYLINLKLYLIIIEEKTVRKNYVEI